LSFAFARVLAVIRILLGVAFLCLGVNMLTNQNLLFGGLLERLNSTGGLVRYYRLLVPYFEKYETSIVYLTAIMSIILGLMYIIGALVSLASLTASFFVLNYALASSSWHLQRFFVIFAIAVLLLIFGRLAPGIVWGVDGWLLDRFKDWLVLFPLRRRAPEIRYPPPKSFVG
jgi:uncharacterized membrane protein YphA (DoxX/SURF4 family)